MMFVIGGILLLGVIVVGTVFFLRVISDMNLLLAAIHNQILGLNESIVGVSTEIARFTNK